MISEEAKIRPSCEELLKSEYDWSFNSNDFSNENQIQNILFGEKGINSNEESFHKFFIQEKAKFFSKGFKFVE